MDAKLQRMKKEKILRKGGATLALMAFLSANSSIPVLAVSNVPNGALSQQDIQNYEISYLNTLSYDKLVSVIENSNLGDIRGLFDFNKDTYKFYNDRNRIEALINALEKSGNEFTKEDEKGIAELSEVLRAGFYLGFYNKELSYLNDLDYKNKCLPALKAIENNENFGVGTVEQNKVVRALGTFIGNASADNEVINNTAKVLRDVRENFDTYKDDYYKLASAYELVKGIEYHTSTILAATEGKKAENTQFYGNIDSFIEEVENLCLLGNNVEEKNEYIINNAIFFTGKLSKFREDKRCSQKALTDAMKLYPYFSYQYVEAAIALINNFNGEDFNGNILKMADIKEEGKNKYLPKTYTFDDGKFIVKAGDKVSEEKIQRLYWAAKEVQAQYMRMVQNDKPLDEGHPDDILNVVIYNSPKEYKLNEKFYGLSVDNGGIYMEGMGTFFTYERTEEESIYTLEELFRHEFTHYLQGRYVVPGVWGRGDFYKDNSLTWYEEGTAEFFAGSTRTEGIKPRKSIVKNIAYDENNRMDLNSLLHVGYGDWSFYYYGFAFSNYMYNHNIDMFKNITNNIKANNVQGYKDYIESLSSNADLNRGYQNNMNNLLNDLDKLNVPLVSDDYIKEHSYKDSKEVYDEIEKTANLKDIKVNETSSQFFKTFDLRGNFTGNRSNGESSDWNEMNEKLNEVLKELSNKEWDGYKTFTAYFTNYRVNDDGNYEYDVVIHGVLTDEIKNHNNEDNANDSEDKVVQGDKNINVDEPITTNVSGKNHRETFNFDVNKTGDVNIRLDNPNKLGLTWILCKEGTLDAIAYPKIDETTLEGKAHLEPGKYSITVYKYNGEDEKGDYTLTLTGDINDTIVKETGNNHTYETAMNMDNINKVVGSFDKDNNTNIYEINLDKETELNIVLENNENLEINWLLYSADNLESYIDYAKRENGNLQSNYVAKPGKYYISVYNYNNNSNGSYKLNINKN
ncbi:MAG: collagenase [Clostridium septicum]|nr:collagenase [Clostridium septicum]MDU1312996.1 collagenase [Clostridium septicum]